MTTIVKDMNLNNLHEQQAKNDDKNDDNFTINIVDTDG